MKYFIISDIHGSALTLKKALAQFKAMECEFLVIMGDILNYGPRNSIPEGLNPKKVVEMLNPLAGWIIAVRGNCDAEVDQMILDFPCMADYALVVDNGKKLFFTHGHIYNEENMPKGDWNVMFYGHTHLWKLENGDGMIICNSGSITFPKQGNLPTFVVYDSGVISVYSLDGELLKNIDLNQ